MYSLPVAYILWFFSGFGCLGFHRFYLNKIGTGVLWAFTGGLGGLGSIYDFFTLPDQVREANIRRRFRDALDYRDFRTMQTMPRPAAGSEGVRRPDPVQRRDTPERIILRIAKKNKGIATPSEVALEGDMPVEEAKKYLEQLTSRGFAEMRVTKNGVLLYVFPDFTDEVQRPEFEDMM